MFYKPYKTRFGLLGPSEKDIIKVLEKYAGGHLTGHAVFNYMGLSTQVPIVVEFRSNKRMNPIEIGGVRIKFLGNPTIFNKGEEDLVYILESLLFIKSIFDTSMDEVIKKLMIELKRMSKKKIKRIIELSKQYRPFVRALLGAMLEEVNHLSARKIKDTLNPTTRYQLDVSLDVLKNLKEWNIENEAA